MHLHFERNSNAKCDCTILSLTWMGKVPDELPEEEGWKLNRTNYYQEGWLATGNVRGIVGVTFTTSHCSKPLESPPPRTNYNLRGHRSEVMLVKWNEPYQKLASCDATGIIFVWIKYEGRWSIELINDRNTPVTHFSWSHDGRMALICYQDGFVLVGSVAGQRYWSSMLTLPATITCGIWTPDDQLVYFGTTAGQLIVMDVHGAMVSQVQLASDVGITSMAWSCEKFKMEEGDDLEGASDRTFVLAVSLQNGYVFLMKSFDDVTPTQVCTGLQGPLCLEWSNSRELLAVAGTTGHPNGEFYTNVVKFYSETGVLVYSTLVPPATSCVTALTWGHNDRRLFVATGPLIHAAWVSKRVASLQLLCRLRVHDRLRSEESVAKLPLPTRLKTLIGNLFAQTIRCCVPSRCALRDFVWRPPEGTTRLHCTMIRHDDQPDTCYTLYLEYLGGLVPLLKGRRTSRIRPEFVVYDPQVDDAMPVTVVAVLDSPETSGGEETSCASPRIRRRRPQPLAPSAAPPAAPPGVAGRRPDEDDLAYLDTLPETGRLAQVTSNIWGTKFKLHGLSGRQTPPILLGTVTYKTSLLHLQPRQMSLLMMQLSPLNECEGDNTFPTAATSGQDIPFSEDEDEEASKMAAGPSKMAPIAPMTPQLAHLARRGANFVAVTRANPTAGSSLANRGGANLARPTSNLNPALNPSLNEHVRTESPLASRKNDTRPSEARLGPGLAERCGETARTTSPFVPRTTNDARNLSRTNEQRTTERSGSTLASQASEIARNNSSLMARTNDILRNNTTLSARSNEIRHNAALVAQTNEIIRNLLDNDLMRNNLTLTTRTNEIGRNGDAVRSPLASKSAEVLKAVDPLKSSSSRGAEVSGTTTLESSHEEGGKEGRGHLALDLRSVVMKRIDILENNRLQEAAILRSDGAGEVTVLNSRRREKGRASPSGNQVGVAATKWCVARGDEPSPIEPLARSCSLGYLDLLDAQLLPATMLLQKDSPKRLVLVNRKRQRRAKPVERRGPRLRHCRKSRSLDSAEMLATNDRLQPLPPVADVTVVTVEAEPSVAEPPNEPPAKTSFFRSRKKNTPAECEGTPRTKRRTLVESLSLLSGRGRRGYDTRSLPPGSPCPSPRLPRSSPNTPLLSKKERRNQSTSPIRKHLLNSPLLRRKRNSGRLAESSDEEASAASGDEVFDGKNYRDLESFQKSQLRQKLLRGKRCEDATASLGPALPRRRELRMRNKAPMWNENSQVYQLDFGGRVTQESAKNFQIEFRGKQVMQFGRIDGNAYTLDFQQPFSALQAFAVALANVTQRLK